MKMSLYEYCCRSGHDALLSEWDGARNEPLTPRELSSASHRMVWWRCAQGHSWCARTASRTQGGAGCPYCAGKSALPGETDLAACAPQLAAEWDRARNGELTPQSVTVSSNRMVWWRCGKGHSYCASVAHRTREGSGCPYCAGRRVLAGFNDLQTLCPQVASQWHAELNGPLTPQQVTPGSNRSVWWQCPLGHVWRARIDSRTDARQCGCPVCAGRTRSKYVSRARGDGQIIIRALTPEGYTGRKENEEK